MTEKRRFILFAHTRPDFHFFFQKKVFCAKNPTLFCFLARLFPKKKIKKKSIPIITTFSIYAD